MSDIVKDVNKVWSRLFDQKGFLSGEIGFVLNEFEVKNGDCEVDDLFRSLENITDIKDTQINRLLEVASEKVIDCNQQLNRALNVCIQFGDLEEKYKKRESLEEIRERRKEQWAKVMDEITYEYAKINSDFEEKESHAETAFKGFVDNLQSPVY